MICPSDSTIDIMNSFKYSKKQDNGEFISVQYQYRRPTTEHLVKIVDFGNACWTHKHFSSDIQTRQYRSPETILGQNYGTSADIWSLSCMLFELATGEYLFNPKAGPNFSRDEDHLAMMLELIGTLPTEMWKGNHFNRYFNEKGHLRNIKNLRSCTMKQLLINKFHFQEELAEEFSGFLMPMLNFIPSKRITAMKALEHPFLKIQDVEKSSSEIKSFLIVFDSNELLYADLRRLKEKLASLEKSQVNDFDRMKKELISLEKQIHSCLELLQQPNEIESVLPASGSPKPC